jgi:PAS domain S-box-containing protein
MSGWPLVSWILFGIAAALLAMAVPAWRRREVPGLTAFALQIVVCSVYVAAFACELAPALAAHATWLENIQYAVNPLLPALSMCFFADFTGHRRWLPRPARVGLFAFAGLITLTKWTDGWHGLIHQELTMELQAGGWNLVHVTPGSLYWVTNAYLLVSLAFSLVVFALTWVQANRAFRRQLVAMALVMLLLCVAYEWRMSGLSPWGALDLVVFAMPLGMFIVGWTVLRDRFASLTPIARNQVFEMMRSAVVVTDLERRVADLNPSAARLLGISEQEAFGRPLATVLARWPELADLCLAAGEIRREIMAGSPDNRIWEAGWHPLTEPGGHPRGFLLDLLDVTARKQTERQLQELLASRTRELREATAAALRAGTEEQDRIGRELHDTLCPDLIGLTRRAETLTGLAELPATARDRLGELVTQSRLAARRARDLSHLLARPDFAHASFEDLLHAHLHHLEQTLGLTAELVFDAAFPSLAPEPSGHLLRIVREAVVNAARHAGAQHIRIECLRRGNQALVSISNDGRPPPNAETLKAGLGLRQMRMRAELLEGSIALRPGVTGGAVVELTFAATDDVGAAPPDGCA